MSTKPAMPAAHQQHQHHEEPETVACGEIAGERNRYFTGKFMTARDFADEQRYHLSRRRLHNRLLHGEGIACGLRVLPHPSPSCRSWVVVRKGAAIDCCGREVILERDTAVDLAAYLPPPPEPGGSTPAPDLLAGEASRPLILAIRYVEVKAEYVPALYAEGSCDPARSEASRVREETAFEIFPLEERPGCWPTSAAPSPTTRHEDCDDDLPAPSGACLDPECSCGGAVALARIQPLTPMAENEFRRFTIDMLGRRELDPPPQYLTHIIWHNWPHGGELTYRELRDLLQGELVIHFDRKLLTWPPAESQPATSAYARPADQPQSGKASPGPEGLGINPFTFVVTYLEGAQGDVELLDGVPQLDPNDPTRAVFTLGSRVLPPPDNRRRGNISPLPPNTMIFITLKCNFILDCHGKPVDGDYLRGTCPTGDGIPGGVFESWFRIVEEADDDDPYVQKAAQ